MATRHRDALRRAQTLAMRRHEFGKSVCPVVVRAERRAGVDHDGAVILRVHQRNRFARSDVRQAKERNVRRIDQPPALFHGDYKLGNAVQLSDGSWASLDLDFVRIRERLYDVAGSLYWASDSGANVDLRELCDAYERSAPEPVTPDERQLLPGQITLIPLHWVAAAGFMDERIGVHGTVGVSEAERAMDAAEAWWARREELTW